MLTWEDWVHSQAEAFPYPPTPALAAEVRAQLEARPQVRRGVRPAMGLIAALLIALGALAVPSVRASVRELVRIGAVRIDLAPGMPSPPAAAASFPDLAGETTLAAAREMLEFPILLPTHPPELGPPDRVYLQDHGGAVLILIWEGPGAPGQIALSLHILGPGAQASKGPVVELARSEVNGQPALWTQGPYVLKYGESSYDARHLVEGNVLVWEADGVTYRLESDLPLQGAVRVAESLESLR
jgi:hypothetical protein